MIRVGAREPTATPPAVPAAEPEPKGGGLPPGPGTGWLPWNAYAFRRDQLGFLTRLVRRFGTMVTLDLTRRSRLFVFAAPEAVGHVLVENARNFTSREVNYPSMPFLGDGLLNIDGAVHAQQRAMIQPAFGRRRVEGYADVMCAYGEECLRRWRPGQVLDVHAEMQRLTLRIVAKALFDVDIASQGLEAFGRAFDAVVTFRERPGLLPALRLDVPWTAYGRMRRGERFLDAFVFELIDRRRAEGVDRGDVLSVLLRPQAGTGGSEGGVLGTAAGWNGGQVRDHVMTLLAAGHETTANALTFALYLLAHHPRERARLQAELRRELGGRTPTVEDLARLPYLEMVVKESLRLFPPAWIIGRRARGPYQLLGYRFPEGSFCVMSQWVTHRLPELWPEPERFRPERWAPPEQGGQHIVPFSYFPFGAGPRTCIGMPFALQEARLLLAMILQRFTPEPVGGRRLVLQPLVTLRPRGGMPLRLRPAG
jgi:cytochrome P450